jgi:hypothetical protein
MARVLEDFLGRWDITREISHGDGTRAKFTGTALWQPTAEGARQVERGTLVANGQSFSAERQYLWRGLDVYFEDGRFFHSVPPEGGHAAHWCDPDQYDVHYDFAHWPNWTARWQVSGPRKDYTMVSRFSRSSSPG